MWKVADARRAHGRPRQPSRLRGDIGTRFCAFVPRIRIVEPLAVIVSHQTATRIAPRRGTARVGDGAGVRAGEGNEYARVRAWTGRAAMSRATSTGVPHVETSGTHRTRVSEMRGAGAATPPAPPPARRALAPRRPGLTGGG